MREAPAVVLTLLGPVSIETTERGCTQKLRDALNDRMGIEPEGN